MSGTFGVQIFSEVSTLDTSIGDAHQSLLFHIWLVGKTHLSFALPLCVIPQGALGLEGNPGLPGKPGPQGARVSKGISPDGATRATG